ncbi:MAG: hypothetical protein PHO81_02970 [Candidatus Omnitrophica bacterium]|nr:hypothetical protein [Candidatus Omnitrophota bacterium]
MGKNVDIGAYAVVEKGARIGDNAVISPSVHIQGGIIPLSAPGL